MRLLLALFAFVALALAPLGMPAEARAMDDHCTEMAGMDHHGQTPDPSNAQPVKSCCTAMPAALPEAEAVMPVPVLHAPAETKVLALQIGLRREVEVPPPRV
ncbi:hypothetical protein [Sphingomonas glaciei]|uniref:DUF2946 domain-containing protein n=1 Tax=Sphingomonas glaciei TaxID=2938948 RepID=A0ABY5MUV2_9SPHN|nr:hypothetical protein [Sphingomonas glaciei]UUR08263.1 hypothetical protein M1K48_01030 [Sphingomonas glaciei]